ncbi:cytochrome c oxidase subunit II [Microvirga sp. TS319]|uniref:cytochrome c oxidase subunit II n=1 Tax=Microvirga sp. TS319 TaxID=3241165 RepID=UPI00351A4CE3
MTYLRTFGGFKGEQIKVLTWALLIQAIVVVVIVSLLVLIGVLLRRSRRPATGLDRQPVQETGSGLSWIYIGVGISTIALIGSMIWNGYTMAAIDRPPRAPELTIEVRGHQWWWEVRYLSQDTSRIFETANEIHIPVGQPVEFRVSTVDVIHSFWIPALGDKIDLIPNQINSNWLEADSPGIYRGQCSEFCGQQHAHMGLVVVADKPADFQAWWDSQLQPAALPADQPQVAEGATQFVLRCGACHNIRGTQAGGRLGPNLSHLMSRKSVAAGTLPNNPAYLSGWIADPQTVKPGNLMPNLDLSGPELASIRTFLEAQK